MDSPVDGRTAGPDPGDVAPRPRPGPLRLAGFVALVLLECGLILYTVRLVGLALERAMTGDWAAFWLDDLPLWLGLAAAIVLLRWKKLHRVLPRRRLWVAGGIVAVLGTTMLVVGLRLSSERVRVPELGIWVWTPERVGRVCQSGRTCWTNTTDEHGLRVVPGQPAAGAGPVLAVIGDSFVFGVGVDDAETLPAQLQRALATVRPGLRVIDAGLPGLSIVSYPAMVRYAVSRYDADWLLLLMNRTDVLLRDVNTRLNLVRDNLLWRLLAALNLETAVEYLWLESLSRQPTPDEARALVEQLDALASAGGGRPLLVVSDWFPAYTEVLESWFNRHSEVDWLNAYGNETWQQAEKLTNDAHWSPRGIAVVIGQLRPALDAWMQTASVVPIGGAPGAPPRRGIRMGPAPPLDLRFLASPAVAVGQAPGDPSTPILTFHLGELGEAQFEARRCTNAAGPIRVGNVCLTFSRPVSSRQIDAVRRLLAEHQAAIEALGTAAP